jgi:hypothetical protein
MGYAWRVGNGRNFKFWEDQWFGSSRLAIQYWDLYSIINEQGKARTGLGWGEFEIHISENSRY